MTDSWAGAPMFNAPRVVLLLIAALVVVHVGLVLMGPQVQAAFVAVFGIVPVRYTYGPGLFFSAPGVVVALALVGYTFLHGSWIHLAVNSIWLLALGSGVARRLGTGRFLAFYFVCGICAALAYIVIQAGSTVPAIGASGAISGLLGAVIRFIAAPRGGSGPALVSLRDRRVVVLVVLWVVVNLAFGRTGMSGLTGGQPVAWEAHLGGFVAGLVLFGLFDRPRAGAALRGGQNSGR